MLEELKERVWQANRELVARGLVFSTWGNASGIDRPASMLVIKPSGVEYASLRPDDMVVVDLEGNVVEGTLNPSSDSPTHLELYRAFSSVGGIVHTHSHFATVWAQACRSIPCFGTTHADYCRGDVPVTEPLTANEVSEDYEVNTGKVIVRRFEGLDPLVFPGVLVAQHGPFVWGETIEKAVESATVLEEIARLAYHTITLRASQVGIPEFLLDKHYMRKHGPDAYYGQK
ncbi:MAG: L-ribulose-5-phosphate 4-epimerase AraD [Candidatus Hydrogenedentes bacterium]|nr:L-ribulose-5-phosphate 4-epimerase AraD [Candidatus Hydrogenedentota bacterium]